MPSTSSLYNAIVPAEPFDPDALDRRDPSFIASVLPSFEAFAAHYLRLRCQGLPNLVVEGPVMFVANHNGGIAGPDLACTLSVLWRTLSPQFPLYALAHDFAMRHATPLGRLVQKLGAVRASSANARRVLEHGHQVLVYPGGDLDAYRHSRRRNEIVILPRTGFIRTARSTNARIVPIVAAGAHRSAFVFAEGKRIARALRLHSWARIQRFPLALALPWGLAIGPWLPYMPLPMPITLRILPPIDLAPEETDLNAATRVQNAMQRALDEMTT